MMRITQGLLLGTLLLGLAAWLGCGPADKPAEQAERQQADDHDHDHDHDNDHHHHDHAHGPRGGHLVELEDGQYQAEWLHDSDSGRVVVFILDGEAKEDVPIGAETITVEVMIGDMRQSYELAAVDREFQDPPATAQFELINPALVESLQSVGHGVEATLGVEIDGQVYTGPFTEDHHHH